MTDVQQLRVLAELSRLGTVLAAAGSLGSSQSTVSRQLAALSRATGAALLTRTGRGVRLAKEGRALVVWGQEALDLLERIEREAVFVARAEVGCVCLAALPSTAASLVPGVLDVIGRQYPGLEVELVDAEPPEAPEALRCGQMDAALSLSYADDDVGEGLQAEYLLDDVPYLVTHPGDITRTTDDTQCRRVTGCARCREELLIVGRTNGLTPETAYASDDYVAVQALAAAGVGAALLPGMALGTYRHEGIQVRPPAREQWRVRVVACAERPWPLAINVLVEACQAAARRTNLCWPAVTTGGNTASQ